MTLHYLHRPPPPDWDARTIPFRGASVLDTEPIPRIPVTEAVPAPQPEPPKRPWDAAIFVVIPGGWGLLCGMDLWRRHADPEAGHYRHSFDALRVSALRAGWVPDLFGRWCCPRCKNEPAYTAAKPLAPWHAGVPHAAQRNGTDPIVSVRYWLGRPATEYHQDSAAAYVDGDPADEFWFRVEAEHGVAERTAQAAVHGRHAAGAR